MTRQTLNVTVPLELSVTEYPGLYVWEKGRHAFHIVGTDYAGGDLSLIPYTYRTMTEARAALPWARSIGYGIGAPDA